jgi:hypothetical protein
MEGSETSSKISIPYFELAYLPVKSVQSCQQISRFYEGDEDDGKSIGFGEFPTD